MSWNEERRQLLQELRHIGGAGRAEGEPQERIAPGFFPVSEHLRLLDPDVVLVVGPRGSGKTEIARVLQNDALRQALSRHAPSVRLPSGPATWVAAYPAGTQGFEPIGLRGFIERNGSNPQALRNIWFAYLLRSLQGELDEELKADLRDLLSPAGADIDAVGAAFQKASTKAVIAVDRLDSSLVQQDRYVFLTYDELDTLGGGDWAVVEAAVGGLVAFWATYARRWQRVRAKLFLRTDLFERHARLGGADLAKLAAGRVDLVWSDRDLYGMLLKRMANPDHSLREYVQEVKGIDWDNAPVLGSIPKLQTWQHARPVIERMAGSYMGANKKKGLTYRWLLDHVRDGRGRALPRPFVRLIEEAARQELENFRNLPRPRLLEPASLRRALDRVSADHVAQSRDEWPWLDQLKTALAASPLVPWDREREVIRLLEHRREGVPLHGQDMLDYLIELGIMRRRSDGRIDVPDLFLFGLRLRRKGGVRRRT